MEKTKKEEMRHKGTKFRCVMFKKTTTMRSISAVQVAWLHLYNVA